MSKLKSSRTCLVVQGLFHVNIFSLTGGGHTHTHTHTYIHPHESNLKKSGQFMPWKYSQEYESNFLIYDLRILAVVYVIWNHVRPSKPNNGVNWHHQS